MATSRADVPRKKTIDEAREDTQTNHLICMGRKIEIDLKDGRTIKPKSDNGMIHDASGKDWPRCSLLIMPFRRGEEEINVSAGRDYFGGQTRVMGGSGELPPRSMTAWTEVGEIETLFYDRAGKYEGFFRHEFHKPRHLWKIVFWIKRETAKKPVVLYKHRDCYRIDMPKGCMVDDRGIILP